MLQKEQRSLCSTRLVDCGATNQAETTKQTNTKNLTRNEHADIMKTSAAPRVAQVDESSCALGRA